MAADLLPSSLPKITRGAIYRNGATWVPGYCINCGADGGYVPEDGSLYYICDACAPKWQAEFDTKLVPDFAFWETVKQEQLEREGRELTATEVVEALKQSDHYLSKLARSRQ